MAKKQARSEKGIEIKTGAEIQVELEDLNFFQGKLKSITKDKFNDLKSSLIKSGIPLGFHAWKDPKGKIWLIDGHHRYLALKALKDEGYFVPPLPVNLVKAKDKKEAAKNVLVSNSKYAKMSPESLSDFAIDFGLTVEDFEFLDIPDLDMGEFSMGDSSGNEGLTDPDEVPEVKGPPKSKLGDIFILGNHRLICGDATKEKDIDSLMDGQKADAVFTDPPYRMEAEGGSNQFVGKAARKLGEAIKHLCDFDPEGFFNIIGNVFPKGKMNAYIFCNKDLVPDYLNWGIENGYSFNILFWKKPSAIPLGGSHRPDVEYLLLFRKSAIWNNGIKDVNYSKCLEFGRVKDKEENGGHPTPKPVDLIENEIKISSNKNGIVVDFFGGSGSTLIACEKIGRRAFLSELDPVYCDVTIQRWQAFTGQVAHREDGVAYNAIKDK